MLIGAIDPFWGVVVSVSITAGTALVGAFLERRHATRMRTLEAKNDEQHQRGYTLLESIDRRTIAIDEKVDRHGEWIAAHELEHIYRR